MHMRCACGVHVQCSVQCSVQCGAVPARTKLRCVTTRPRKASKAAFVLASSSTEITEMLRPCTYLVRVRVRVRARVRARVRVRVRVRVGWRGV